MMGCMIDVSSLYILEILNNSELSWCVIKCSFVHNAVKEDEPASRTGDLSLVTRFSWMLWGGAGRQKPIEFNGSIP
jgi:hypothetical protein